MSENKVSYELDWSFERRLATQHLGALKYTTSAKALSELVANGFDAEANNITITIKENELGGIDSIIVTDDGCGITSEVLKERFTSVGVIPEKSNIQFAKFGIGRFAVHRIGEKSYWKSITKISENQYKVIGFELDIDEKKKLKVSEEIVENASTGTEIQIFNIRDKGKDIISKNRIAGILLAEFCSFLLAHPNKNIVIQNEKLDANSIIAEREVETIQPTDKIPDKIIINHLILNLAVDKARFPAQIIFTAKGRMITNAQPEELPLPQYIGIVECDYLDSIVSASREALIEMDNTFAYIKSVTLDKVNEFGQKYRTQSAKRFIEKARSEEFYPYKDVPQESTAHIKQAIYDVVLEKVNENANIEGMTKKQRAVVFKLLNRALDDENLLDVLTEVAKLSDDDVERFKNVLERTALTSIIKLSSEVTDRLLFLDILHELVYGDIARRLKERSQLHKIIEPNGWLFGPRFHLATSDESFRKVIRKHRNVAGLEAIDEKRLLHIDDISKIPDLFFYALREYPTKPKNHHLLVEIKAPSVSVGAKERDQIRKYAEVILNSSEFDKSSTRWDLFIVSSKVSHEISRDREQKDKDIGCLWEWDNMAVWAFEWSEIITRAKEEMQLVRNHLKLKTDELSISDYLRKNFPEILGSIQ